MAYLESVDNALRLLVLLSDGRKVTVTSVARELGVAPSTAHRLLATLVYRQFAVQGSDRTYSAGPAMLRMAEGPQSHASLLALARPCLREVVRSLGETCHISILVDRMLQFLMSEEATHALHRGVRDGQMLPAHRTAGGKALLARLSPEDFDSLYPPDAVDQHGVTEDELRRLRLELADTRRRGYAVSKGTVERGLFAVAVPIVGQRGTSLGALSASLPTVRYSAGRVPGLVSHLRSGAERIAETLSFH